MRVRRFSRWAAFFLTVAAPAFADGAPPAIWYRASDTCPNGGQFLDKLTESSRRARLAEAGDHIDFVVTLVENGKETVGRLERQTDSGIVAIRELRDATCEQVADALALSLGLALAPGHGVTAQVFEESTSDPAPLAVVSTATELVPAEPSVAALPIAVAPSAQPPTPPVPGEHPLGSQPRWSVGLELGAMIGISTEPMPRGQVFIDWRPALSRILPNLSLRAGAVGAGGSSETAIGTVGRWILAGRVEGCPVAWSAGRFDLRPCFGFELGATGASAQGETGVNDRTLWAAPAGQLRFSVALVPRWFWLEANGGMLVPLIRNEIFSGSQALYRDAPAVFHGNLGISLRLP